MRKGRDKQTWLPKVLLEIPGLDEDHQRLLGHVNALIAAVASKAPAGVQSAISELQSETEAHFAREETLMLEGSTRASSNIARGTSVCCASSGHCASRSMPQEEFGFLSYR